MDLQAIRLYYWPKIDIGADMTQIQEKLEVQKLSTAERRIVTKVWRRILWFSALLLLVSQVDKHNIAFAAITMRNDLNLTATMFGMCISIFYIGYVMFEIPSNLIMARVGARTWLARIAITLGLVSAGTIFATGPNSLLLIRFLLGVAEAGMVPGLLLYFTYWFPQAYRARANACFLAAMPIAGIVTSILSGAILNMDGILGLAGWRWLFLLLGLPSIILGIIAFFYLTDKPEKATWLDEEEKRLLANMLKSNLVLDASHPDTKASGMRKFRQLFTFKVFCMATANMGVFIALSVITSWTPQIVRALFPGHQFSLFGWVAAVPAVITAIAMPFWSHRSDKRAERKWHLIFPLILAILGLMIAIISANPWFGLCGLTLCSIGVYGGYGVFWSLVSNILPDHQRPAGIALIHAFGTIGAICSPVAIGFLRDVTGSFSTGFAFASAALTISIVMVVAATRPISTFLASSPYSHSTDVN